MSKTQGVRGISLTEVDDANPKHQGWHYPLTQKLEFRLTVELEPDDRLMRWKYVPDVIRMDKKWWKILNGEPYKWWVYFGVIPPDKIVQIFNTKEKRHLSPGEIDELKKLPPIRSREYATTIEWISFEDALRTT
ncbi:MAG TPA: hypothetical protein VMH87_07435 [Pseudomonadales bacterium]|nr:hypothetical protein [Pseudomonadales bacterium]